MMPPPLEAVWWPAFGMPAVEAAVIVGLAAIAARGVASAVWRRTVWQGCLVALLGMVTLEFSGSTRQLRALVTATAPAPSPGSGVRQPSGAVGQSAASESGSRRRAEAALWRAAKAGGLPQSETLSGPVGPQPVPAPDTRLPGPDSLPAISAPSLDPTLHPVFTPEQLAAWLVLLWLGGALAFLALNSLARMAFARHRRHSRAVTDPALLQRVAGMATRLGVRGPVQLRESSRWISPVAAGVFRPVIGLPSRFSTDHSAEQQDAMLAHELAHLAARDPFWYLLADGLAALLWWHPLAWWARRQLHAASETAADEASLLLPDGPRMLAECLVALGDRLTRRSPAGGISVEGAGFRSDLGRRVERLLRLPVRAWAPPSRVRALLARTLAPAALVAAVIFCAAWTLPQPSTHGDRMNDTAWKRSLPLWALLTALSQPESRAFAAAPPPVVVPAPQATPAKADPLAPPPERPAAPAPGVDGAAGLKAKLDSIVLDEVNYDSLPLAEVVRFLIREAAARDPEKEGVNFLFGQPTEALLISPAVDPATGLPIAGSSTELPDLNAVTIRITPPLRKVRLIDALDAIKRVADHPITYSVESYAVVFSLDVTRMNNGFGATPPKQAAPSPANQFQTRSFKVNTNTFFPGLRKMYPGNYQPHESAAALRQVFEEYGAKLNSNGNRVLYNDLTGMLLVRCSPADFETIQAVVETLGGMTADATVRGESPAIARNPDGSPATPRKQ